MSEENKTTLREFSNMHGCRYGTVAEMVKRLRIVDETFRSHVTKEGTKILLDDTAVSMLRKEKMRIDLRAADGKTSQAEYDKLIEKKNMLAAEKKVNDEKHRQLTAEIRKNDEAIRNICKETITGMIYKILGRSYISGDEIRLADFLADNEDFKTAMNKNTEVKENG